MKYLLSSYTKHTWAVYMGKGGEKWARDLVSVRKVERWGIHWGSMLLPKLVTIWAVWVTLEVHAVTKLSNSLDTQCIPHRPTFLTDTRSRAHFTSP